MKHCDKCDVDVESNLKNCPLCGAYLRIDDGDKSKNKNAYREVNSTGRSRYIMLRLLLFVSLLASIVCLVVDVTTNGTLMWSMHLVVAIVGTWLVLLKPMFAHTPLRVQIVWDMAVAVLVIFYAEYYAKSTNHWAFHLALPIVFMAGLGAYAVLMVLDMRHWTAYAMTATPLAIMALIPIFISLGVFGEIRWAWYVVTGIALIMLVSFFIFGKQSYVAELRKRLHF